MGADTWQSTLVCLHAFAVSAAQREADILHSRRVEKSRADRIAEETHFTHHSLLLNWSL